MKISVVCPFYNESAIIENAAKGMLENLSNSEHDWELIAVNDGSTDNSLELISSVFAQIPNAKVISYPNNQGRGYALKTGIDAACGDIIVTTEIDLSWGNSIVTDIVNKFLEQPKLDAVIASPNLKGGGYRNVPWKRVFISKVGNIILRTLFTKNITMNTGMTRGYRREIIQPLRVDEKGKEFHLEILLKMINFGYKIGEVPATLEWKDSKLSQPNSAKRKSSTNIKKIMLTHMNFAVFANPIRYMWALSLMSFGGALAFFVAFLNYYLKEQPSIYLLLVSLFLGLFCIVFFGFGIVASQNNKILKELWRK